MKKNMDKRIILIAVLILSFAVFTGCTNTGGGNNEEVEVVEVQKEAEKQKKETEIIEIKGAAPVGAPVLSLIKVLKENPSLGKGVKASYEHVTSPDLMASKIVSGEVDFAIVPSNLAIKLHNKGVEYKYCATGVWGVLYIVSDQEITSWEDLKGKEINMLGRGLTPDIVTRFLLEKNGLVADVDVTFNYVNGGPDLAKLYLSGENVISIMPEPMLSKILTKKTTTNIVFDLQNEWKKATGGSDSYPQAALIIKNELIEKHPEIADSIIKEYERSIKWVNENPTLAGEYSEELETGLSAKLVEMAISRSNLEFKNATDSREALEAYYNVLFESSPDSIGGKMPDDSFYYEGK